MNGTLVLSRKLGESIWVGDALITFISVSEGKVRVAINADKSIPVDRAEIRERREREAASAAA